VDLIGGLAAKYCIRQDARGFIELWGLSIALTVGAIATLRSSRFFASVLIFFVLAGGGVALATFWSCYESAGPSLGVVLPNSPARGLDAMICLSSHAVENIEGWILLVVSIVVACGLAVLGVLGPKSLTRRALVFAGAAAALLFAIGLGALLLFGISWCQSSRLF